jgi:hypothetical protein
VAKYDEAREKGGYCWHLRCRVCLRLRVRLRRARRRNLCEQGKKVQENTQVNKISLQRLKVTKQATAQVTTAVLTQGSKTKKLVYPSADPDIGTPFAGNPSTGKASSLKGRSGTL